MKKNTKKEGKIFYPSKNSPCKKMVISFDVGLQKKSLEMEVGDNKLLKIENLVNSPLQALFIGTK